MNQEYVNTIKFNNPAAPPGVHTPRATGSQEIGVPAYGDEMPGPGGKHHRVQLFSGNEVGVLRSQKCQMSAQGCLPACCFEGLMLIRTCWLAY